MKIESEKIFTPFLNDKLSIGEGCITDLSNILKNSKKILMFTGKKSFDNNKNIFKDIFNGFDIVYYSDFSTDPKDIDIRKAVEILKDDYDTIIAFGGGSVIDFAKLYKFNSKTNAFFIAIPTTAGTGSEATKFAVIYVDGIKQSIEDECLLPNYAIVDSQFLKNSPKYLKICTSLDALIQAIESYWSTNSTDESRELAKLAMRICKDNILKYINFNDDISNEYMLFAAHLSGKAINISKTTAAHALSYIFTIKYGIPHGHAVALSIVKLFEANLHISVSNLNDKRGMEYVYTIMQDITNILGDGYLAMLFQKIGLEINLNKLEVNDVGKVVEKVNLDRLKNNPRKFTMDELKDLFYYD